jgi:hypothetical protein
MAEAARQIDKAAAKYDFMRPIWQQWVAKLSEAKRARKKFDEVGAQCRQFFSDATGFMWGDQYQSQYFGSKLSPRFKITLQKAFELVAIFGPTLYWKNPVRACKAVKPIEYDPEDFMLALGGGMSPEMLQQNPQAMQQMQMAHMLHQQAQGEQMSREAVSNIQNGLYNSVLNYMPGEMPHGGLAQHAETAITEGLVSGRGILWPEHYKMPGSEQTLVGSFFDRQENLYIDPDATGLHDAWWIAKRCVLPTWKVEQEYGFQPGALKGRGNYESSNNRANLDGDDLSGLHRAMGKSNDLMVIWKIWSKMGVGDRLAGGQDNLREAFSKTVGDYAYLVISPNVPFPLNAPTDKMRGSSDQEIARMLRWPVPWWRDNRWPFCELEFYRDPLSPYPIPPMAPGLGELAYLNVFISHIANRVWSSSRDFIAYFEGAAQYVEEKLKGGEDMAHIKLPVGLGDDIRKIVSFLQQPQLNADAWQIIDRIAMLFERRVGLSELLYGMNPGNTQSRSTTDAEAKREMVSVRPEYMAGKVESWMSECADMEKMLLRLKFDAQSARPIVGDFGAMLWGQFIDNRPIEEVMREMRATVEAGSARKPNRQRDAQNMGQAMQMLFGTFDKHADVTQDTTPLNMLVKMWGDTVDLDTRDLQLGPRQPAPPPPPSPEEQQAMQQQQQMEQAKLQAELQGKQMDAQGKQTDLQGKVVDFEMKKMDMQGSQLELQRAQQDIVVDQMKADQDLLQDDESHDQGLDQTGESHRLEMRHRLEEHMQKMDHEAEMNRQKVEAAKAMAKAKARAAAKAPAATNGKAKA